DDEVARARVVRGPAQLAGPGEAPAEAEDGRGIPVQPDGYEGRALAPGAADPDVLDAREHVLEEVPVDVVVDPPGVEPAGEAEGECGADAVGRADLHRGDPAVRVDPVADGDGVGADDFGPVPERGP